MFNALLSKALKRPHIYWHFGAISSGIKELNAESLTLLTFWHCRGQIIERVIHHHMSSMFYRRIPRMLWYTCSVISVQFKIRNWSKTLPWPTENIYSSLMHCLSCIKSSWNWLRHVFNLTASQVWSDMIQIATNFEEVKIFNPPKVTKNKTKKKCSEAMVW